MVDEASGRQAVETTGAVVPALQLSSARISLGDAGPPLLATTHTPYDLVSYQCIVGLSQMEQ